MADTDQSVLRDWFKDGDAVALGEILADISQVWDDLIDRDVPVSNNAINTMMRYAMIDIPKNAFYQRHFASLHPVMEDRLYTWFDANLLEQTGGRRNLQVSYVLRSVITDILIHMAYLEGGFDHRQRMALLIRQRVFSDMEPMAEYIAEQESP